MTILPYSVKPLLRICGNCILQTAIIRNNEFIIGRNFVFNLKSGKRRVIGRQCTVQLSENIKMLVKRNISYQHHPEIAQ